MLRRRRLPRPWWLLALVVAQLTAGWYQGRTEATLTRTTSNAANTFAVASPWTPATVSATAIANGRVTVTWSSLSWASGGYKVYRRLATGGASTLLTTASSGSTSYTDTSATDGTSYVYLVSGVNTRGTAGPTTTSGSVTADATAPSLTTTLSASRAKASDSITVTVVASESLAATPTLTVSGSCITTTNPSLSATGTPNTYSVTYSVPTGSTDCTATFAAAGSDPAGNASTGGSATLTVDRTAPTLTVATSSTSGGSNAAITVTVTSNETLSAAPTVTLTGSCVTTATISMSPAGQAASYSGTYTVPSGTTDCSTTISATGSDLASNSTTQTYTGFSIYRAPPTVTSYSPTGTGVAVLPTISATFSKAMNSSTLSTTTVIVEYQNNGGNWVGQNGTVSYTSSTNTVTVTLNSNLPNLKTVRVTISGTVADTAGNQLGSDFTWSFITIV